MRRITYQLNVWKIKWINYTIITNDKNSNNTREYHTMGNEFTRKLQSKAIICIDVHTYGPKI